MRLNMDGGFMLLSMKTKTDKMLRPEKGEEFITVQNVIGFMNMYQPKELNTLQGKTLLILDFQIKYVEDVNELQK